MLGVHDLRPSFYELPGYVMVLIELDRAVVRSCDRVGLRTLVKVDDGRQYAR